jgi:hypothetical protein
MSIHINPERHVRLAPIGHPRRLFLQRRLAVDGYHPTEHTHGLWKHETRLVWFSLVVDDFVIKYAGCEHTKNLMASIKKYYEISNDWTGSANCGLKIGWDHNNVTVDLSMPGYIKAALHKYHHPTSDSAEHAPHTWNPPVYDRKTQYTEETEDIPSPSPEDVNHLQFGGTLCKSSGTYFDHTSQCTSLRTNNSNS